MVEVAAWLRAEAPVWSEQAGGLVCAHERTRLLLTWLQKERETRRVVQATIQKTLREAIGPELFCGAGLPDRPGLVRASLRRAGRMLLPMALVPGDLAALLQALFPEAKDERWLRSLDDVTRARLWKLVADDGIAHALQQQIDEALHFLVNAALATGARPEVRQRLGVRVPLRATPFMALRRELEKLLALPGADEGALRSVRMLLAVCQAQTDKVYQHLDEHGVSVSLVAEIERLRAQLTRIARLLDLRGAIADDEAGHALQLFLADSVRDHHRSAAGSMIGRSFSLLARKVVERNDVQSEHYLARDRQQYRIVLKAGCVGGVIVALTVLGMIAIDRAAMAGFFEGAAYAALFGASLLSIAALGGTLAARQSPVVAPVLAARMGALDTVDGLRGLLKDSASLLRAQVAATAGNLATAVPVILVMAVAVQSLGGIGLLPAADARYAIQSLSLAGPTPVLAIVTGLMCWLASLAAGLADNWFALHRLREAIAHHPGLRLLFGAVRSARFAAWCARHVAAIAGSLVLALLLGTLPALGDFLGFPIDLRLGVLSAGLLAAALASADGAVWQEAAVLLALAGVASACVLNVMTAYLCSLALAMHARHVEGRARGMVLRSLLRRLRAAPGQFLLPPRRTAPTPALRRPRQDPAPARHGRRERHGADPDRNRDRDSGTGTGTG
ncbi:MAG: preprotein translocase subunit TatB [Paucimonas sp.]|nr:preprotein translocase subunit TatB [Paucimonas sp.]